MTPEKMTPKQAIQALDALRDNGLAWTAFFIGLGWIEGAHYCRDRAYLEATGVKVLLNHHRLNMFKLYRNTVTE